MPRGFTGNDVVDLREPLLRERFFGTGRRTRADADWLGRHLGPRERDRFAEQEDPFRAFWILFAAKEAAWKALAQAGIRVPDGAYPLLQFDPDQCEVVCLPSGDRLDVVIAAEDADRVHCVATLHADIAKTRRGLAELPEGEDASSYAREELLRSIAIERGMRSSALAVAEEGGIPRILDRGRRANWSVSLSHAGRFVAFSYLFE